MMTTSATSIRRLSDLNERYSRLAKETGRSRAYYITEVLENSIDRLEYEYGILKKVEDVRAGRAKTYTSDEVRDLCGLAD